MKSIVFVFLFLFSATLSYSKAFVNDDDSLRPSGPFQLASFLDIKGVPQTVSTLAERDSIATNFRTAGMLCYVTSNQTLYYLNGGIENDNWKISGSSTDTVFYSIAAAVTADLETGTRVTVVEKNNIRNFVVKNRSDDDTPDLVTVFAKSDSITALVMETNKVINLNVEWFGAVGDGKTNNYTALQKLVKYVNARGGYVRIYFPAGDYFIDTFKIQVNAIKGGDKKNNISDLLFSKVKNVQIVGYGAKINCRGNFKRSIDKVTGTDTSKTYLSYHDIVQPLAFQLCDYLSIEGLELDGNVDQMSKDPNVVEGADYGLSMYGCTNVYIKDMYIHHFPTDGIILSRYAGTTPQTGCRNLVMENVKSYYNGRQSMTLGNIKHGLFINCEFSHTGEDLGAYGGHAPRLGIDCEPSAGKPVVDVNAEEILFYDCKWVANMGGCISAVIGTENLYVHGGLFDNSLYNSKFMLRMGIMNFVIEGATIYTGTGLIYPVWGNGKAQRSLIRNNTIYTKSSGILVANNSEFGCTIEGNNIIGQHDSPLRTYFPYVNANVAFKNNVVFVPKAAYGGNNRGLVQRCSAVEKNTWLTDLDTTGGKFYTISYSGSKVMQTESYPTNKAIKGLGFIGQVVLPVELLHFNGYVDGKTIRLNWQTSNEVNTLQYTIERKVNNSYMAIGTVYTNGDLSNINNYQFTSSEPAAGTYYYRLKIEDLDGSYTYSAVVPVTFASSINKVSIYPNPATTYIIVEHSAAINDAQVEIIDMSGRKVRSITVAKGNVQTRIDVNGIAKGTYMVVWYGNFKTESKTLLI